jgi:hypothetical protein
MIEITGIHGKKRGALGQKVTLSKCPAQSTEAWKAEHSELSSNSLPSQSRFLGFCSLGPGQAGKQLVNFWFPPI